MATSPTLRPSPPPLVEISRIRFRVSPISSSQISRPWIILLFLSAATAAIVSAAPARISYADHCGSIVPESVVYRDTATLDPHFELYDAYFSGGEKLLGRDLNSSFSIPRSLYFRTRVVYGTEAPGVVRVGGSLIVRGGSIGVAHWNFTRGRSLMRAFRARSPRVFHQRGKVSFDLWGFWSESAGKLCMVGSGVALSGEGKSLELSAVFKLNYPKNSNITNSLVTGTVKSLDAPNGSDYFDTISLLAYSQKKYDYTLIPQARKMSSNLVVGERILPLGSHSDLCELHGRFTTELKLVYKTDCQGKNCSPFDGYQPSSVSLRGLKCSEDGRLHLYLAFSDSYFGYHNQLVPDKTLVGEGIWDREKNHLSVVACRVLNFKDSLGSAYVGGCTIGFSLWFPAVLSIKNRSPVGGRIWSTQSSTGSGYVEVVSGQGLGTNDGPFPGVKYEYTKIDLVRTSCAKSDVKNLHGRRYPDGKSVGDMRFDVYMGNVDGERVWGYAAPLSIGERLYGYGNSFVVDEGVVPSATVVEMNHSLWNVSYRINCNIYNVSSDLKELKDISAEGIYNVETGTLCMVGCRDIVSSNGRKQINNVDCGILINVQLPSLNAGDGGHLSGTISSTWEKSDPLYFKPLKISSDIMYKRQAVESIWRMDVEITMVLISLTLLCAFIGLQLFHVKKNPDVLPSTSLTMLVILTLGHMIPLVLNFEALFFMNRNKQNVLLWSGGWLEVNEVIVRLITMVAFLLQFRFLQLAWSARSAEEGKKGLWVAERKALQLCLPLYFVGVLITWFVHLKSYEAQVSRSRIIAQTPQSSLWEDLISYAGLVLDGFLLPQVLLNMFWNSKEKVLIPAFYIGTTIVRALPHIYDAYRAHYYVPHLNSSYIYASPEGDFYSSAWDIIIPCEGILFAIIIYLQQRYGGSCILPPWFRKPGGYETVPVVSG